MTKTVFVCELCGHTNEENKEVKQIDTVLGFQITANGSEPISYEFMNCKNSTRHICTRCLRIIAQHPLVNGMLVSKEVK